MVEPDTYTVDSAIVIEGEKYCGSFDFNYNTLLQLQNVLSDEMLEKLKGPFEGTPISGINQLVPCARFDIASGSSGKLATK